MGQFHNGDFLLKSCVDRYLGMLGYSMFSIRSLYLLLFLDFEKPEKRSDDHVKRTAKLKFKVGASAIVTCADFENKTDIRKA